MLRRLVWFALAVVAGAGLVCWGQAAPAADPVQSAEALAKQGKWAEAAEQLRQHVETRPGDNRMPDLLLKLADAQMRAGFNIVATETYARFLNNCHKDGRVNQVRLLLAESYEAQGQFKTANAKYNTYLRGEPDPKVAPAVRQRVAEIYDYVLSEPVNAAREYESFIQKHPSHADAAEVCFRLAMLYDNVIRNATQAAGWYESFVTRYPKDQRARLAQSRLAYLCEDGGLRDWPKALKEYRRYIELFPDAKDIYEKRVRIAWLYRDRLGQHANALKAYDEALAMRRSEDLVWERQEAVWQRGKDDEKIEALQACLKAYPETPRKRAARQRMAEAMVRLDKGPEAAKELEALIKEFPDGCAWERWMLAECLYKQKQRSASVDQLVLLIKEHATYPGTGRYDTLLARATEAKVPETAEKALQEALPRYATMPEHYCAIQWRLGRHLLDQRRNADEALKCFRDILEKYPFYGPWGGRDYALKGIVDAHTMKRTTPEAIAELNAFFQKNRDTSRGREAAAMAAQVWQAMATKDTIADKAIEQANQVINHDLDDWASVAATLCLAEIYRQGDILRGPEPLRVFTNFGRYYLEKDRLGFARAQIEDIRKKVIEPALAKAANAEGVALYHRAMMQHAMGQFELAAADYEKFVASGKGDPKDVVHANAALEEVRRLAQFKASFDGGELDKLPTASLISRAELYVQQRRLADAVNAYQKVLARAPGFQAAAIRAAEIYDSFGVWNKALPAYLELVAKHPKLDDSYRVRAALAWYHYSRDKALAKPIREMIEAAAAQRPSHDLLYWAILVNADRDPRDYAKAAALCKEYEKLPAFMKDEAFLVRSTFDCHIALREQQRAVDYARFVIQKSPSAAWVPEIKYRLAETYRETRNYEEALKTFNLILRDHPQDRYALEALRRVTDSPDQFGAAAAEGFIREWMKKNPDSPSLCEAYRRLGNILPQTNPKAKLEAWNKAFSDWPFQGDASEAANSLIHHYASVKDFDAMAAVCQEMIRRHGGGYVHAWERLLAHYRDVKKDDKALAAHAQQVVRLFPGYRVTQLAYLALSDLARKADDTMAAAIALHRAMAAGGRNDETAYAEGKALAETLAQNGRFGEAASVLRTLMAFNRFGQSDKDTEKVMSTYLTRVPGGGGVAIDATKPEAGLLYGDVFCRAGDDDLAWKKYQENKANFPKFRHLLSPAYIRFIAERLNLSGDTEQAIDVCRTFIIKNAKAKEIPDNEKAAVQLLLGDCYFRTQQYDTARAEYQTVLNFYKETAQAVEARFCIGRCFMEQKMFEKAEEIFLDLAKSEDEDTVIRAELMRGLLYHMEGKKNEAIAQFKQVLALNPGSRVADELFFRLGEIYHESRRFKEALDLFRLVGTGGRHALQYIQPGQRLRFRLTDKDLSVARQNQKIPIRVTTTSGDEETVLLQSTEAGSGIFVGEIPTALGKPAANDKTLQLKGDDIITSAYDPVFAKDFELTEEQIKGYTIKVSADADLKVSATEIKEEDEEDYDRYLKKYREQPVQELRRQFRQANQVKPGNFIYTRVQDADMDRTDEKDKVTVFAEATSGDRVKLSLEETEAHSGIFRGKILTGNRPPDATSSDNAEGHDARYAIDGRQDPDRAWEGENDSRFPKTFTVDLKEVYDITRVAWTRGGDRQDRLPLRYAIDVAAQRDNWLPVAVFPEGFVTLGTVHVMWDPDAMSPRFRAENMLQANGDRQTKWAGRERAQDWIVDLDLGGVMEVERVVLRGHDQYNEVQQYSLYMEEKPAEPPYPAGRPVRDMKGWKKVHTSAVFNVPVDEDVVKPQGARGRYMRVHVTKCFHANPEIGELEVVPVRAGKVTVSDAKNSATIAFPATPARFVRMTIFESNADAPALAGFSVFAGEKKVAPVEGVDVHKLANDDILQISPGDKVSVTYVDENNINPGRPNALRGEVEATFHNGRIEAIKHFFYEDDRGNRQMIDRLVSRVNPGDRFIIQVTDYDADTTDGVDALPIKVVTSGGQTLTAQAAETGPYSGTFTKEVDTALTAGGDVLQVKPGETITASYMDAENTDPGNKVERKAEVQVSAPTRGEVLIYESAFGEPQPNPDKAGKSKLVSLEKPLVVEVRDPDVARHSADTVTVQLKTTSGAKAEVACYIAGARASRREEIAAALEKGVFIGEIPLFLGDAKSPETRPQPLKLDTRRFVEAGVKQQTEQPVLNVNGSDVIEAIYADQQSPGEPANTERRDTARLVTNGVIGVFDDSYEHRVEAVHLGENLYVKVEDGDADVSAERDSIKVVLTTSTGDRFVADLTETLTHSGVFSRAIPIERNVKPDPQNDKLEADFDAGITLAYEDAQNVDSPAAVTRKAEVKVVIGSDGVVLGFGKKYPDDDTAVETQFRIGECYYYLGRRHMELAEEEKRPETKKELEDLAARELAEGQRILQELVRVYPDSKKADQAQYLLASLAQEQKRYDEAIDVYREIVNRWPDSPLAPDAQYKVGMCFEKKGDFDSACEEYVRLAYQYPDSVLIGDAMIRIGLFFFNDKKYPLAIGVFKKFTERHPLHKSIEDVWFKLGMAFVLNEEFGKGAEHLERFVEKFPETKLKPASLYWAGDSYFKSGNKLKAYQMFKRVVWDFPESKWAKWARGQLTNPAFENVE